MEIGEWLNPNVFSQRAKPTSVMDSASPDEVFSRLPLFGNRKHDWALLYPVVNVLLGQHAKIAERKASATDSSLECISSDVFTYTAYLCDDITGDCQPVVTAGQLGSRADMWCTTLEVHAKHSSDVVRFLDLIGQPFAFELRRKIFFHCTNENDGDVVLPPMYVDSLKDAVPTACPALIGRRGETPAPRLVNDIGPESWPRAWKLHDGSQPFDVWPRHVRGKALDLRHWSWEPNEEETGLSVVEVAYNAFLFVVRSSEEQVDLRAVIGRVDTSASAAVGEGQTHVQSGDVPCVYVTSKDWKSFACVVQMDDLLVLSVWTEDSMARTSSKKWGGGQQLSDLLQDCLQRFYFPSLPKMGDDGQVAPW